MMITSDNLYILRWCMRRRRSILSDKANVYRLQGLSCMNCAAKFEKNIRDIETVEDVQLNLGASKLTVYGHVTIDQLEEAGAFDYINVFHDTNQIEEAQKTYLKISEISATSN